MAIVNKVKKTVRMELWTIIRFQLAFYCYIKGIVLTEQNLDCLTLLAMTGELELSDFCERAAKQNIFKNAQSVRTALPLLEKKELIQTFKQGKNKKRVKMNSDIVVQTKGNILLELRIAHVEST